MGYLTLRDIAKIESVPHRTDVSPDDAIELTFAEFEEAVGMLSDVGMTIERTAVEAWPHFRGWRVNYEEAAYNLAKHIDAVPALWSGPRRHEEQQIAPIRPVNKLPTVAAEAIKPTEPGVPAVASVGSELAEEGQ
jgi:hypothetical protein